MGPFSDIGADRTKPAGSDPQGAGELAAFARSPAFTLLPVPSWVYDTETLRFLAVNDAALEVYGYGREAFLTMGIVDIRPTEDVPALLRQVNHDTRTSGHRGYWRHKYSSGRVVDVFVSTCQMVLDGRRVAIAVLQDVSAMKAAEAEATQKDVLLQAVAQTVPSAMIVSDWSDGKVLFANRRLTEIWRIPWDMVLNVQTLICYTNLEDRTRMLEMIADQGCIDGYEVQIRRYDDTPCWIRMSARAVTYRGKRAILALISDITEERRRDADERRRSKLEALGQLAGGVAHEINNLLQPVVTIANLNLREADLSPNLQEDFRDILASARQCRDVVGDVLAFARKEGMANEPLDLVDAVRSTLASARNGLPPAVMLAIDLRATSAPSLVGRTELTQVLMNLLANAADAMEGAGTVTVLLENHSGEKPHCRLSVRDEGCGMNEDVQQRIFEPFFTTKPLGRGTGLGLSVVHGIVRTWGGTITAHSAPGEGTTFHILIPLLKTPH